MGSERIIGVAGATGALGREVLAVLDGAPWRPDRVVPLASAATSESFVRYGDADVAVDNVADQALEELDGLIVATPAGIAEALVDAAIGEGVFVVDASGVSAGREDVPLVVPWVNPDKLITATIGAVGLPHPASTLLGSVLAPLRRAGITGPAHAQVLLPASTAGRAGVEELSRQVVAMFSSGTPPRKVFADGLAFDVLPAVGAIDAMDGVSAVERRVQAELEGLLPSGGAVVTAVRVPVFSGVCASILVHAAGSVPPELALRVLEDGGVRVTRETTARQLPRPRNVEAEPFARVGRARVDEVGALHLWAAMDNLRGSATAAVGCLGHMLRDRGA